MKNFKGQVESYLSKFFDSKIKQYKKIDPSVAELCGLVRDFTLNGGKRIRALLIYHGYIAAGGKNPKIAIKPAAAFELIHSFLLIHDDIIDRSDTRRHDDTVHIKYQKLYKKDIKDNKEHFGNSMAILAGDLALSLAYEILDRAGKEIPNPQVIKNINQIIQQTIIGETLDVAYSFNNSHTRQNIEKTVNQIHLLKTAKYTVEGPLHAGALLGNAGRKRLNQLSKVAIPLGIAYQIKDDIDGVFGNEQETGKSITSDIKEGKLTLLTIKAYESANPKQKNILDKCLGNKDLDEKGLEEVKEIIKETGALEYSQEKISQLLLTARKGIKGIDSETKEFFHKLIKYINN